MPDDTLQLVTWPAGSLEIHGSEKHVKHVAAEYLMAKMKVQALGRTNDGGKRTSTAQGDSPAKEVGAGR